MRVATRRSDLARAQAAQAARLVAGDAFELVALASTGDLHPERAIADFNAKGLFVDAIREAVLAGDCDVAVHSYKDLPTEPVDGLVVGAVPPREDPRDLLVTRDGHHLASLPDNAIVGTSSERRRLQLLRVRPDLQVLPVRGNLPTRLGKVASGELDAVVVALAGLRRLYRDPAEGGIGALDLAVAGAPLEPGQCLPSPAQGALAIECRADDRATLAALASADDPDARAAVTAERAFLATIGGGCSAPIGALASSPVPGVLEIAGLLADPGRRRVLRKSQRGTLHDPTGLGRALAEEMLESGGRSLVEAIDARRRDAS